MRNHADEEDGIEPWEGAIKACDQAPADGKEGVARVMDPAGVAVPAIDEQLVPSLGIDRLRVLKVHPREGRGTSCASAAYRVPWPECILLCVALVPDYVDAHICDEKGA